MATTDAGPLEVLSEALKIFQERGATYGDGDALENNFGAIATIATLIVGKPLTARDVALVLTAVKLRRLGVAPDHRDSYVDAVNYVAFAAALLPANPSPKESK